MSITNVSTTMMFTDIEKDVNTVAHMLAKLKHITKALKVMKHIVLLVIPLLAAKEQMLVTIYILLQIIMWHGFMNYLTRSKHVQKQVIVFQP